MYRVRTLLTRTGTFASSLLVAALFASPALAQNRGLESELSLVESEIVGLERRIGELRSDVSGGALTRSPRIITERFNEARYGYLVEDYERCALIFHSLLENDDLRADARKAEAQWYLAECLYLDGNLPSAQERFQLIVDLGGAHPFYGESLLKLIELYGRTGDSLKFNEYYTKFVASSQAASPTALRIRYEMGKTLFQQGKLQSAQGIFAGFPRGSTYTPQANYFSAVILTREGAEAVEAGEPLIADQKFKEAIRVFRTVLTLPTSTPEHREVVDLTHLAIARLAYEQGEIAAAIPEYTAVREDSKYYADALYELVWANIEEAAQLDGDLPAGSPPSPQRRAQYAEALRAIEIFNLAFPGDAREGALRLLAGHVRVRMERFDQAVTKYEDAAGHFAALKGQLAEIVSSGADPMLYFNQLVDTERYSTEADLMVPEEARRRAQTDPKVAQAVGISGDLYDQQSDIDRADSLLDLLEEALVTNRGVDLIQTYRIHRQQLASAEAAVFMLRNRLIEVESSWLRSSLSGTALANLDRAQQGRDSGETPAERLSRKRRELEERRDAFHMQADAIGTRAYHVQQEVEDQRSRLAAIEQYLIDARKEGKRSREEELALRADVDKARGELRGIEDELARLDIRLEPRVLTGRLVLSEDDLAMRDDTATALTSTESELAALRRSASGGSDVFQRIDSARTRLAGLQQRAAEARKLLDRAETKEVADVRREVEFQRNMVDELMADSSSIDGSNRAVSGRIGRQAFVDVADYYEDMLTRADMGVIDVFWYRKESTSQSKKEMAREKNRRLRALQEAYSDVLEER